MIIGNTTYFIVDLENIESINNLMGNRRNQNLKNIKEMFAEYRIPEEYHKLIIKNVMSESRCDAELIECITEYPFVITGLTLNKENRKKLEVVSNVPFYHPLMKAYIDIDKKITERQVIEFYSNLSKCGFIDEYISILNEVLYDKGKSQSQMHTRVKKMINN